MDKYYLLIFNNTHGAMKAESFLKAQEIKLMIMPTPTHITQSCGISIRIAEEEIEIVKRFIIEGNIEVKFLYARDKAGYTRII